MKIFPRTLEHGFGLFGIDSPSTTADALTKPKGCRANTNKVQLLCFELFHDSYCSGFSRNYLGLPSHLTSETISEAISNSPGRSFGFGEESGRSTYQAG